LTKYNSAALPFSKMPHAWETEEEILKLGKIDPELDEASNFYLINNRLVS